jgi:hypothetical protein
MHEKGQGKTIVIYSVLINPCFLENTGEAAVCFLVREYLPDQRLG